MLSGDAGANSEDDASLGGNVPSDGGGGLLSGWVAEYGVAASPTDKQVAALAAYLDVYYGGF